MAVTHSTAVRSALATEVLRLIDRDSLAGKLVFKDGTATVAVLTLSYPAATELDGELTFGTIASDFDAVAGTIDTFEITDNSGTVILEGSVTVLGGGGDITLSGVVISNGDTVGVTELAYIATA